MGIAFRQAFAVEENYVLREAPETFDYHAMICFRGNGWAGFHLGIDKDGNGFAFLANLGEQEVHFLKVHHNSARIDCGMKRLTLKKDVWMPIRALYDGSVLRVWLNENPLDEDPWPKFEFPLKLTGKKLGCVSLPQTAEFCNEHLEVPELRPIEGETFTNPIMIGADPDILLCNGTYYLYNRIPNDPNSREDHYLLEGDERAKMDSMGDVNAIFRVTSSTDLVHWTPYKPCLMRKGELAGAFCMSPNVFHKDGWFYLLFAAGRFRGEENFHIHYAVSRTPDGPFEMKTVKPLHTEVQEIGGMPFVDLDGQVYITYVRFDRGNNIFLQSLDVKDGVITPDDSTLVPVLRPEADYEVDEYGRIVEGGVIIPHKGLYYMMYADGHYLGHYGESYAVADNIYGPYVRYRNNPILHHHFMADGTGDGIVIYNADRSQMYIGYHRHVSTENVEPRMSCIDPMKFIPDPDGGPDILTVRGPSTVPQKMPFSK